MEKPKIRDRTVTGRLRPDESFRRYHTSPTKLFESHVSSGNTKFIGTVSQFVIDDMQIYRNLLY